MSEVCDEQLAVCADETKVIYVDGNGTATTGCTRAAPCKTIAQGLSEVSATRSTVKIRGGTYTEQLNLNQVTATLIGAGASGAGATVVEPPASNQSVVVVTNGAQVSLDGMRIAGVGGTTPPAAIQCSPGGLGITPTLKVTRSVIRQNAGSAISISGCQFSLIGNIIASNGNDGTPAGAVTLGQLARTTGTLFEFAFNTVTDNEASENTIVGVECVQIGLPLTFSNNIIFANPTRGASTQVGGDTDCTWTYSDIGPQAVTGTGNINADPRFKAPGSGDFHLEASSPARNAADPAAAVTHDIDGDSRPQGGRSDMGADEVRE